LSHTKPSTKKICGELTFLRVYSSGWGMGRIKTDEGTLAVTGSALAGLKEYSTYEFNGATKTHPIHGDSFCVDVVNVFVPSSKSAIISYLSKNYSGVGTKTAEKYVDQCLASGSSLKDLRETIIANPFGLDFSKVTTRKTNSTDKGGVRGAIYRLLSTRLGGPDTSDAIFRSLANYYAKELGELSDPLNSAWELFTQNPYAPIRSVSGYGFQRADILGKKLNIPNDAEPRIAALATYAIDEGCGNSGHTYLDYADFSEKISSLDRGVSVNEAIQAAISMGEPIIQDGNRFYLNKYFFAETQLANNFQFRIKSPVRPLFQRHVNELNKAIGKASKEVGINLDESQHKAVLGILGSSQSIHTLTAGPGAGKTALVEVIVSILHSKMNIGFCAPTGKAAKCLSARVSKFNAKATTIHSMLGVGERGGFLFNESNKLSFELLVVDESSMLELTIMNSVMSAVKQGVHVLFLGDAKQLPSVGPGDCLANLLQLPFDHHRLTKTHRNDGGILEVINSAGDGQCDLIRKRSDVVFIDELPEATEQNVANVLNIYDAEFKAVGGDFSAVGLLIARRKGDPTCAGWNTTYLNTVMREKYNGDSAKVAGTTFRVNDRIIIRKNLTLTQPDYEGIPIEKQTVVNGDTGFIRGYDLKEADDEESSAGTIKSLILELDDGRTLHYSAAFIGSLDLAYCMTVHSAQGSEYQRVISICVNGAPNFIHRGILFTSWSRAQTKLTIIGEQDAIKAILRRPCPPRNSFLVERVCSGN